jgi:hypothetical protein
MQRLIPFAGRHTSLQMDDFESYLAWVKWCQEASLFLGLSAPLVGWRARDVEMACFTDSDNRLPVMLPVS